MPRAASLSCLLAALLFGAATPASKALLGTLGPITLAGMLYLGAAIAVFAPALRHASLRPTLDTTNVRRLLGAVTLGGVIAPVFLLVGLSRAPAASVALWLNLEVAATAVLAWAFFREHLDVRAGLGVAVVLLAGSLLAVPSSVGTASASIAVGAACLCWGLDNNLTSRIDGVTPAQYTFIKGLEGGFSGLYPVAGHDDEFWTLSDRGPNGDTFTVAGTTRRPFLSPAFTPTIYRVRVDTTSGRMTIVDRIPLKLPPGSVDPARPTVDGPARQITGFGNTAANAAANVPASDEVPTTDTDGDGDVDATDATLPFDPYGLDTEGIVVDPRSGSFWIVEEYRPSIVEVGANGTILQRLTPQGQNLAALGPAWGAIPLRDVLPAIYSTRRDNRGFEGVAISADGNTLYAIVQNPLATTCTGTDPISGEPFQSNNNRSATRIVKLDISNPSQPILSGDFLYTLDTKLDGTALNSELRISDLFWVGTDRLLVDERDDHAGTAAQGEPSTTRKRLYEVDLTSATNIQTLPPATQQCLDALKPTGVAGRGVTAGTKLLRLDLGSTDASAEYPISKLEGIVRRANGNFATVDDNDFQVGAAAGTPTLYIEYGNGAPAAR